MTTKTEAGKPTKVGWSLAMIVRDAEAQIGDVLDDATEVCDELIVVDTGSNDDTMRVAAEHGARVVEFQWIDDFSAARNASFEQCSGEWILWLDADDRIPPEAQEHFLQLKKELEGRLDVNAVMMPYNISFSEADPSVCTFSFDRERVIRRRAELRWAGPVHECIDVRGPTMRWPAAWVEHRPRSEDRGSKVDRNLMILERAWMAGDDSSRTLFYLANELRDHQRWEDALLAYREYFTKTGTVVWERYSALLSMATCADALGNEGDKLGFLLEALKLDSTRAEAFMRFGYHYYNAREWQRAVPFFAAACSLRRPTDGFIEDSAYTWAPWDFLSVCHSELAMYEEALEETVKALRWSDDRQRLMKNIEFYLDQLRSARLT